MSAPKKGLRHHSIPFLTGDLAGTFGAPPAAIGHPAALVCGKRLVFLVTREQGEVVVRTVPEARPVPRFADETEAAKWICNKWLIFDKWLPQRRIIQNPLDEGMKGGDEVGR